MTKIEELKEQIENMQIPNKGSYSHFLTLAKVLVHEVMDEHVDLLDALEEMLIGIPDDYKDGVDIGEHTCFNGHSWKTIDKAKSAINKAKGL